MIACCELWPGACANMIVVVLASLVLLPPRLLLASVSTRCCHLRPLRTLNGSRRWGGLGFRVAGWGEVGDVWLVGLAAWGFGVAGWGEVGVRLG